MAMFRTLLLSELRDPDGVISAHNLAYLRQRFRNNLFSHVLASFRKGEESGLTKAKLARRIGYDPARITKLLSAPGNLTTDTVSDLLAGISAEELVLESRTLLRRYISGHERGPIVNMPKSELAAAREWAQERLRSGTEPPWTYYRLMQLIEAIDSLINGANAVSHTGHSQQLAEPQDAHPRQEGNIYRLENAQSRRDDPPIHLPT